MGWARLTLDGLWVWSCLTPPLQTLTFYNAIANGGEMVKPKFLKQISRLGNPPEKVFRKEILNPAICSQQTVEKAQQMMFNVVDKKWERHIK